MMINNEEYCDGRVYTVNTSGVSEEEFNVSGKARNASAFALAQRFIYANSEQALNDIAGRV
jgi:hypothetical protein